MAKEINIPNALSCMRILTIPVISLLILHSNARNYPILITVFFFSILLDFFDGFLARKLAQETELGKILDPIADKLMVLFIILALMIKSDFPLWLGIAIILRDFLILLASLIISKKIKKPVTKAEKSSRPCFWAKAFKNQKATLGKRKIFLIFK